MYLKLRVISSILSAIFVAAVIPVGIFNWSYAIICALAAFVLFGLTLIFKQKQLEKEQNDEPQPDFLSPIEKMKDTTNSPINDNPKKME